MAVNKGGKVRGKRGYTPPPPILEGSVYIEIADMDLRRSIFFFHFQAILNKCVVCKEVFFS